MELKLKSYWQNFIDGRWVDGEGGRRVEVEDPATAQPLAEIALAEPADVDAAVAAADRAFASGPWPAMRPPERAGLLLEVAAALEGLADEVTAAECLDNGKRLSLARGEAASTARYFRYYAGLADKLEGASIPLGQGYVDYTVYEPFGVTAHVVPWNYPLNIAGRSVACALAAGNTAVVKSPPVSPLSVALLGEAAQRAGLPPGVLNVLCGRGTTMGEALIRHRLVRHVVFTGSYDTGRRIMAAAADRAVPCVLELGGKSAGVAMADADPEAVAADAVIGAFSNSGQICSAESRLLVHRSISDRVLEALEARVEALSVGPGRQDAEITPLISADHLATVAAICRAALDDGARAVCGGHPVEGLVGHFMAPTVFAEVAPESAIAQREVFGPVLVVMPFDTVEEAVELANGTPYGLVAGVYTRDISLALWTAQRLRAGQVFVNQWYAGGVETPFGGWGASGFGREKGRLAIYNYVQTKNVALRVAEPER